MRGSLSRAYEAFFSLCTLFICGTGTCVEVFSVVTQLVASFFSPRPFDCNMGYVFFFCLPSQNYLEHGLSRIVGSPRKSGSSGRGTV